MPATGGQYEDLFDKPLNDYSEEELLEMANDVRTRRKYPAVDKKEAKTGDAINDLIGRFAIKQGAADGNDTEETGSDK